MNIFNKIYFINLNKDINKKLYFMQQISNTIFKNQCQQFIGVDGSVLDMRIAPKNLITESAVSDIVCGYQKVYGVSLTYGSFGCALSHYLIYQECAEQEKPYLIFEDDIIVNSVFNEGMIKLQEHTTKIPYDMIYIGYNKLSSLSLSQYDDVLSKPSGLLTGLYGYIVSPQGARKLLNTIFPLNKQIDSSISDNMNKINVFCVTNPLVDVNTSFGSKTQREQSCKNSSIMKSDGDSWYELFA